MDTSVTAEGQNAFQKGIDWCTMCVECQAVDQPHHGNLSSSQCPRDHSDFSFSFFSPLSAMKRLPASKALSTLAARMMPAQGSEQVGRQAGRQHKSELAGSIGAQAMRTAMHEPQST